jgi:hypothetical protein
MGVGAGVGVGTGAVVGTGSGGNTLLSALPPPQAAINADNKNTALIFLIFCIANPYIFLVIFSLD